MKSALLLSLTVACTFACTAAHAADTSITVPLNIVDEKGTVSSAGDVVISESPYGLIFSPALSGLPAGLHGFHVHENPSCEPGTKDGKPVAALAAGGHWDPAKSGHHAGPYGDGHLGDLPALYVTADGKASYPVLAPRLHALNIELAWHVSPIPPLNYLTPGSALSVLRIVQEAINNALQHAHPSRITVSVQRIGGQIVISVSYNGHGGVSDMDSAGRGLRGMRARADKLGGQLDIAVGGQGTEVKLSLPLLAVNAATRR